jgi:hypothetical protein
MLDDRIIGRKEREKKTNHPGLVVSMKEMTHVRLNSRSPMSLLTPLPSISTLSDNLIIYSSGSIPIISKELNLKQTLLGGQSFR